MNNNDSKVLLEVKNLKKYFPLQKNMFGQPKFQLRAVDDVSFKLDAGKTIGVVGESGCGKTTLGRTILQLYDTTGGKTLYYGHSVDDYLPNYYKKEISKLSSYKNKFTKALNLLSNLDLLGDEFKDIVNFNYDLVLGDYKNIITKLELLVNKSCEDENLHNQYKTAYNTLKRAIDILETAACCSGGDIIADIAGNSNLYNDLCGLKEDGLDLARLTKSELRKLRTEIQLIFQDPYSSLPPRMTVGSILSEAVKVHKIVPKDQVRDHIRTIMRRCGLQPQYYDRYPHEFSGGQRQRICIARALAVNPKLVICDEPVSALDVSIQAQIINLLKELQNELGLTYMFISHDLSVVKYITDSIIVMYLGNMMEVGDTDDIFQNPLHPYTQALFSAVPVPDPDAKMQRIILKGDIPSPANPPKGCKFHTRCVHCKSVCKLKQPKFIDMGNNHVVACHLYDKEIMADLAKYDEELAKLEKEEQNAQVND